MSDDELASALDRSLASIRARSRLLGLSRNTSKSYQEEEVELPPSDYKNPTVSQLIQLYPERSLSSIRGPLKTIIVNKTKTVCTA